MFLETLTLLVILLLLLYKWVTRNSNYFEGKNVKHDKFIPFVGSFKDLVLGNKSMRETMINIYKKFDGEKIVGIFDNNTPSYLVRDPELIKKITVKEFDHFINHKVSRNPNDNLFGLSVFSMADQKWRDMRSTLSPAFTGSKKRLMFDLIREVSEQAVAFLKKSDKSGFGIEIEMRDFFNRLTNDAIATTAFGIRTNSLEEQSNTFFETGKAVINFTFFKLKFLFFFNFRIISKILNMRILNKKYDDYFKNLVIENMKYRKRNNVVRNDLINLLMDAKGMSVSAVSGAKSLREWTDEEIVAQCFVFFFGGLDTIALALSFIAYELMANPDCQKRLIREVEAVKEDLNGEPLTYDALRKLKYMDAVVNEGLRVWSPAPTLDRICNRDIEIENEGRGHLLIKTGDIINIPVIGLHTDPKYFSNPNKFDPDRFFDNEALASDSAFMPFGIGPRMCIANRFAMMEIKTILYHLLDTCSIRKCSRSHLPIELKPTLQPQPKHGFWVKMVPTDTEEHKNWMSC